MITSKIEMKGKTPTLVINGERVAENAYISYFREKARYDEFKSGRFALHFDF